MIERGTAMEAAPELVLVVDDDAAIRALFARVLRDAGYDTLQAADGVEALEVLEREPIALLLLDSSMPRLDGPSVIRAVRERAATRTLPVILVTGSGDDQSLVAGLGAGADDFLAKPVRFDELVARVGAHLRSRATWSSVIEEELRTRAAVVAALGRLAISSTPEEAAETVVAELARRAGPDFIAVTQLARGERLLELATYNEIAGVQPGGALLGPNLSRDLLARARGGPWVEDIAPLTDDVRTAAFAAVELAIGAGAPIYGGDQLVGLLSVGLGGATERPSPARKAALLAATIDYASILSALIGPALAERAGTAVLRAELEGVLAARAFHPVFQPIVELGSRELVGYEALTRFADGTRPDVRFGEAASVGLGHDFELAAIEVAFAAASYLPEAAFLSLNASPGLVLDDGPRLRRLIATTRRRVVLELTEHVPISDYRALRAAMGRLGAVELAVDDAGAGYASLRHILELRPTFVKLDISLVRGIERDELRQALAAGLDYFALRSGCHLIAEGVETEDEAAALERLGIEFAQGYLLGRPAPIMH
ncbi:MAG: EAL domain-containing protein [Candidatus Limnocylindrales bacterium]